MCFFSNVSPSALTEDLFHQAASFDDFNKGQFKVTRNKSLP